MNFAGGLLTILLVSISPIVLGCTDQCCDLNCWEQCFTENTDEKHEAFYQQVYQIVQTIRNLYLPCSKPHGTAYMLDSSVFNGGFLNGNDQMNFERYLASIIALTQPVSNQCNPFFVNKYFRNWAFYNWGSQCKDRCDAADTLETNFMGLTQSNNQANWIGGGCYLSEHAFNNQKCGENTTKELLIAFANSAGNAYTSYMNICNRYNRVVIDITGSNQNQGWASPGLAYQLVGNRINLQWTRNLLYCMKNSCCKSGYKRSKKSNSEVFYYNLAKDFEKKIFKARTFEGTHDEFVEDIIRGMQPREDYIEMQPRQP